MKIRLTPKGREFASLFITCINEKIINIDKSVSKMDKNVSELYRLISRIEMIMTFKLSLKYDKKIKWISTFIAFTVTVVLVFSGVNIGTAQQQMDISDPQFRDFLDSKEKIALDNTSNPEISKLTNKSFSVNPYFYPTEFSGESEDKLLLNVTGTQEVKGDWQSSYEVKYRNNSEITARIVDGRVTSTNTRTLPDITENISYDKDKQFIIGLAMQDEKVKQLITSKSTFVRSVYYGVSMDGCPSGNCAAVMIDKVNSKETVVVVVNTATSSVIDVRSTGEW